MSIAALVALLLAGCMPSAHHQAARLEGRYALRSPGAGWSNVPAGGADHAWHHAATRATIYTDSNCGPRFDEQHAGALASELVGGLHDIVQESEGPLALAGRVGVARVVRASLDGVPVKLALGVLNRDACTYDFVLIAPPAGFDAAHEGYARVLAGFSP